MPMPTYINERPVKTGCWTEREDDLLAEWQSKYGNRLATVSSLMEVLEDLASLCDREHGACNT